MPLPEHTTLNWGPWYRRSPYFEATLRAGCSAYDIYQHMYHPNTYGDPVEEYWALVNDVTLWDVSVERIVEITGPDAGAFTNLLTCRDLTTCAVKQGKYVLITAPDGGIVNDPVLLRVEENRWWLALADSDAGLYAMGVAVNSGLDVNVSHPEVYPVQVQGPKAKDTMRDLFGDWILDMKYYWCDEADLDGIPVVISRTGWTAVVGYEIYLRDPSRGDDLWERILDAGKPYGIRVTPSSDIRRMEAGIFDWGSDFGLETNPFEVTGPRALGRGAGRRLHRQGRARAHPAARACRASSSASRSRASRSTSRRSTGRCRTRARPSGTSPTRAGRRAWRRTSATSGCRSSWPHPARASTSRRTTVRARRDRLRPVHRPEQEGPRVLSGEANSNSDVVRVTSGYPTRTSAPRRAGSARVASAGRSGEARPTPSGWSAASRSWRPRWCATRARGRGGARFGIARTVRVTGATVTEVRASSTPVRVTTRTGRRPDGGGNLAQ